MASSRPAYKFDRWLQDGETKTHPPQTSREHLHVKKHGFDSTCSCGDKSRPTATTKPLCCTYTTTYELPGARIQRSITSAVTTVQARLDPSASVVAEAVRHGRTGPSISMAGPPLSSTPRLHGGSASTSSTAPATRPCATATGASALPAQARAAASRVAASSIAA